MSIMICLAGLPGVGKTTWATEFLRGHPDYLYFSPDAYYERINGDEWTAVILLKSGWPCSVIFILLKRIVAIF